jgi:putative phosphoesterase
MKLFKRYVYWRPTRPDVNRLLEKNLSKTQVVIGLISDTHGLMRPEALVALKGVDVIIHAGDIGKPEVIAQLKAIAPVVSIRGNNDTGAWAKSLPENKSLKIGSTRLFVIHDVKELEFDPAARGYQVVVSGHSHKPSVTERDGVVFVNPGSAGPRRFRLPVVVAKLAIIGRKVTARIVELAI